MEDVRNIGLTNGKPAVLVILYRQPGANIIDTVDRVKAEIARTCRLALPPSIQLIVANDRTGAIRQSLRDVERTMLLSIPLVIASSSCSCATAAPRWFRASPCRCRSSATFGVMYVWDSRSTIFR